MSLGNTFLVVGGADGVAPYCTLASPLEPTMKAILEFELPEDQSLFDECHEGHKYLAALQELDHYLRDKAKHHDDERAREIRDRLREILSDCEVTLWK